MRKLIRVLPAAALAIAVAARFPGHGRLPVAGVDILPWILPGVMSLALIEALVLTGRKRHYDWPAWFASAADAIVRQWINILPVSLVTPAFAFAWHHRIATLHLQTAGSFALLLLGQEFCYYWLHRASHRVRWFWATHAVHHSPNDFTLAAAYRLGWSAKLSGEAIFNLPLIWLGFAPSVVSATLLFSLLYQFWLHTELVGRLGWLEYVFNTPAHHRRHHACNDCYLDRNFGGVLILFDRLFGTLAPEHDDVPCRYGLTRRLASSNPVRIATHEWVALLRDLAGARSWRERLGYCFGPPGWAPVTPTPARTPLAAAAAPDGPACRSPFAAPRR